MDATSWQASLLTEPADGFDPGFADLIRHDLAADAWLDHGPAWLGGSDRLFEVLRDVLPWAQRTERIHGRDIPQPRLTARLGIDRSAENAADGEQELDILARIGDALSGRYGVSFTSIGVNLYRDGRDSVAWHGDRVARDLPSTTIAIVSLGEARPFRYRPAEGGASAGFQLGHGDLLVMGGSFQRTWRHAVPKVRSAGPRMSVTYRHDYPAEPYRPPVDHDGLVASRVNINGSRSGRSGMT